MAILTMREEGSSKYMVAESSAVVEVIKTLFQTISIVVGWLVVHKLSAARDRDKARREMLAKTADALSDEVGKLFMSAKDYHAKGRDSALEDTLKMSLQDLSARTSLLSDISKDAKELGSCRSAILAMKKAITATHFEDEHDGPLKQGSQQIQTITAEGLRVKQCFLRLKHRQFPTD